jgi:hypothetical protein
MLMKWITSVIIICLALTAMLPLSGSAAIIQHVGSNDPTTESWIKVQVGISDTSSAAVNDGGTPAWNIQDLNPSGDYLYYHHALAAADFNDPAGWTYTARVRSLQNLVSLPDGAGVGFGVGDSSDYFMLNIVSTDPTTANNGIWLFTGDPFNFIQLYAMDTKTAYHTYQIIYNPAQSDRVGVFVDGVWETDILRSQVPGSDLEKEFLAAWFGAGSTPDTGEGNWNYVAFDIGQHPGSVPLPGAMVLLGSGLLRLAGWRRLKKD